MSSWITNPQWIPGWLTLGRTILLPKTEDLSHEKDYRPVTCLNTCYKIYSGMIGKQRKLKQIRMECGIKDIWGHALGCWEQ